MYLFFSHDLNHIWYIRHDAREFAAHTKNTSTFYLSRCCWRPRRVILI